MRQTSSSTKEYNHKNMNMQKSNQLNNSVSMNQSSPERVALSAEHSLKQQLFDQMKKSGVLDSLKSQLRGKLYEQLKLKNQKSDLNLKDINNRLSYKVAVSLIADLMKKCDMPYALSVFLPECGISQEVLTKSEIVDVLAIQHDDHIKTMGDSTPLILDIVDQIKKNGSVRPNVTNSFCQTEDVGRENLSLEQKLRNIDYGLMEKVQVEKAMPFKCLEERMLKYKRESDQKYQIDLEKEIKRLKDFELSKIKLEEAQKYREKLNQFTEEMEKLHLEKVKELSSREQEVVQRIKQKEQTLEQIAYEHRQKVLKDEEMLRYKEAEVKKTMEMELLLVKQERDKTFDLQRQYELKLNEMQNIRLKLEKEMAEELSNFKSNYQRQFQDKDFEIHRRILGLEEDENRIKLQQERLHESEKRNATILSEIGALRTEIDQLRKENNKFQKENLDYKDQVRSLNDNLKREIEISKSKESEARVFGQENRTVKQLLEDSKEDYNNFKTDQNRLIQNLRIQMDETKEIIQRIKEQKDRELVKQKEKYEEDRKREAEKYQFEYDQLRNEIHLFARKLGQEENLNKQLSMLNYKLRNNIGELGKNFGNLDVLGEGVKSSIFYPKPEDQEFGRDEFNDRKNAWMELEKESQMVKQNIKQMMNKAHQQSGETENNLMNELFRAKTQNLKNPNQSNSNEKKKQYVTDTKSEESPNKNNQFQKNKKSKDKHGSQKINRDQSDENIYQSKELLEKQGIINNELSQSSQSKIGQTQKRQWKAPNAIENNNSKSPNVNHFDEQPQFGHFRNDQKENENSNKKDQNQNNFEKERGLFNTNLSNYQEQPNFQQKSLSKDIDDQPQSPDKINKNNDKKSSLFGSKKGDKNVFNPFQKKTPSTFKGSENASKEQNQIIDNFGMNNSQNQNILQQNKMASSGLSQDKGFQKQTNVIDPNTKKDNFQIGNFNNNGFGFAQKDTGFNQKGLKTAEQKQFDLNAFQKAEEFGSGGSEDNYEDDFEIGESIANLENTFKEKKNNNNINIDDFFKNDNKKDGGLNKGKNNDVKLSDKEPNSSGIGFDDDYEDTFL